MTESIVAFAATDRGRRRDHNEDAYLLDDGLRLYVVADGMGGARGGEVASQMAVQGMREALVDITNEIPTLSESTVAEAHPLYDSLPRAVRHANRAIHARAESDPRLHGMGTTLTGVGFDEGHAFLVHVGDSRAYRVRGRNIQQLSDDHTYVGELIRAGTVRPEDASSIPWRHVLMRAVGVERDVDVDVRAVSARPGDLFVLCSDGLANVVGEDEIRDAMIEGPLSSAPDRLVDLANSRGGPDNITVVVVQIAEVEANDDEEEPTISKSA